VLRFFFQHPIDRSDEAIQHPDDHGIDVHHAVHAEIEHAIEQIRLEILQACDHPEQYLRAEQDHRHDEIFHRQFLAAILNSPVR
jgi:hypothetical protein